MTRIAEFLGESTGWNGTDFSGPKELIPLCGTDGTYRCDGRKTLNRQIADAIQQAASLARVREVKGVRIMEGGKPITDVIPVNV